MKYNGGFNELSIGAVWELSPEKFFFVTITSDPEPDKEEDYINGLFVLEGKTNIFRQSKICLDGKFRLQMIDFKYFGSTSMIRGFDFKDRTPLESPIYYIDNENEKIVAKSTWKVSYLYKYSFPGYDGNAISENMYENGDVT